MTCMGFVKTWPGLMAARVSLSYTASLYCLLTFNSGFLASPRLACFLVLITIYPAGIVVTSLASVLQFSLALPLLLVHSVDFSQQPLEK